MAMTNRNDTVIQPNDKVSIDVNGEVLVQAKGGAVILSTDPDATNGFMLMQYETINLVVSGKLYMKNYSPLTNRVCVIDVA